MNNKPKILFTATFNTPFITNDLRFLQKHYVVTDIFSSGVKTLFWYNAALKKSDITFSWFASVYSSLLVWLAKQRKKKSIIVIGGVDVARLPSIKYGIWTSWWKSKIVRYGLRNADAVLAVDESLKNDAIRLAEYSGKNINVIPTGYDHTKWVPSSEKKHDFVLTVANCFDMIRAKIKGIHFLFDVATAMPNVKFILIGMPPQVKKHFSIPNNVTIYPFIEQLELLTLYQQAKVYFQPSFREGLPNTLCEAMLCECYPVGTNVGGIPTAIGNTGSVINYDDLENAQKSITYGLQKDHCPDARERIMMQFSQQQREEKLRALIESLTNGK
ncbi:MAG: glycosyltransferase family 4 protein [Bacteroidota bacterium]|nr:glycosyltransferase family 4 protein [Bacteroidota bacterium]